jgi:hypothetical protein
VSSRGKIIAAVFVLVVGVLGAVATANPNDLRPWAWVAALVLTLPLTPLCVVLIYAVTPIAWNLTHADNGGPTLPVTLAYTACFVLTAMANVALVEAWRRRRTRTRDVPPGWYADPFGVTTWRWWDGRVWTQHVA